MMSAYRAHRCVVDYQRHEWDELHELARPPSASGHVRFLEFAYGINRIVRGSKWNMVEMIVAVTEHDKTEVDPCCLMSRLYFNGL